jgi:hypothetical protein
MKMRSMAENHEKLGMPQSPQPYHPTFSVDETQLPEAKTWKIGKKYKVMVEVLMAGSRVEGKKNKHEFKMLSIGVHDSD